MAIDDINAVRGSRTPAEMFICIDQKFGQSEFLGTSEMLKNENLVFQGFSWPEGFKDACWRDGQFEYWLRRSPPKGVKGPRKAFAQVDWWSLRRTPVAGPSFEDIRISLKKKELEDLIHAQSRAGRLERAAHWKRFCAARDDAPFQAFKALLPGLASLPRGRNSRKTIDVVGG